MEKYELVAIIDANLLSDEKETIIREASDVIAKCEGKVINSQVWIDKHKFPFRMKKCQEGTYYLINFESQTSAISKMRQILKLNEKILRSLIIRLT